MTAHVTDSATEVLAALPAWITLLRAPNPGPMTLDGTNTWLLRAPDGQAIVVDPGPDHDGHLTAVAEAGEIRTVITTHHHPDHTEGVPGLLARCPDARIWQPSTGDTTLAVAGLELRSIATPGHTADSITLVASLGEERVVLTGDTILGRGTTVIADPDGNLGQYLDSLRQLERLGPLPVLPGHGPALSDCAAAAAFYLRHRLARLDEVRAAQAAGATTAREVVQVVYRDVDPRLWPAAEASVRAQLAYLASASAPQASSVAPASPQDQASPPGQASSLDQASPREPASLEEQAGGAELNPP